MADVISDVGRGQERRAGLGHGMDHTPPPRQSAMAAAGRHTAHVRFLRRAMIVGSGLAVSIIAIVALFDPFHHLPQALGVSGVGVEGTMVTMESPKISGLRPDGGVYAITARQGLQDIMKPAITELRGVDATIGMADKTSSRITADVGVYDGKADMMVLTGHARIKNNGGYDLLMQTAVMNFQTGEFLSHDPVTVAISGGSISARQLDITENGHKISFFGDVSSHFQPEEDAAAPAEPAKTNAR